MNESDPAQNQPLQFETAEGMTPGRASCGICGTALVRNYHEVCGQAVCASCRSKAEESYTSDKGANGFLRALLFGAGAAIVGGLVYWGVFKMGFQIGIIAIGVGWLVGKAIMKGTNQRGGRRFQLLAVTLTYLAITMSYGAILLEEAFKDDTKRAEAASQPRRPDAPNSPSSDPAHQPLADPPVSASRGAGINSIAIGAILLIILASPFLAGFSNIIGLAIIAFGLWEAWRQTREVPFWTGGPFELGKGPGATLPPAA